jgi:anti-sigma regulatory factor (Ser/Thr protein kinase)
VSSTKTFRHEAFLYDDDDEFARSMSSFVREGLADDEDVLAVLNRDKTTLLRDALGPDAEHISFGVMEAIGQNPARIIPAWRAFIEGSTGRGTRGIGEPVWAARSDNEVAECHIHESLLNVAFADASGFWLVCPYDASALPREVIDQARITHPYVRDGESQSDPVGARSRDHTDVFGDLLPEPDGVISGFPIAKVTLLDLREVVSAHAREHGLPEDRIGDLVLAVSELASNSVSHGGGHGVLFCWRDENSVVCEVRDSGHVAEPLVGSLLPPASNPGGRGLWLVNQLCDLVQLRSSPDGTRVRVHMRING